MRMSPSEAVMWAVEKDPALRSDFTNVTVLDSLPLGGAAPRRRSSGRSPRSRGWSTASCRRRCGSRHPSGGRTRRSRSTTTSAASRSPSRARCATSSTSRQVVTAPPLDRSRPLWEFTLVEGLAGGRAALLQRLHHTITDGVGGMRLSLSLVDLEREPGRHSRTWCAPSPTRSRPALHDDADDAVDRGLADRRDPRGDRRPRRADRGPRRSGRGHRVPPRHRAAPAAPGASGARASSSRRCAARCSSTDRGHSAMFATRSLAPAVRRPRRRARPVAPRRGRRRARASTTSSSPACRVRSPRSIASSASGPRRSAWRCR